MSYYTFSIDGKNVSGKEMSDRYNNLAREIDDKNRVLRMYAKALTDIGNDKTEGTAREHARSTIKAARAAFPDLFPTT